MSDRRGSLVIAVVCFILAGGLLAFAAFGDEPQTSGLIDWTIEADTDSAVVFVLNPDPAEYWKTVTLSGDGYPCRIYEFVQVAAEVDEFLPKPDDPTAQMTPAIYVQPLSEADRLRAQADEIERRSAVLLHWRKVLAECKKAILGDKP